MLSTATAGVLSTTKTRYISVSLMPKYTAKLISPAMRMGPRKVMIKNDFLRTLLRYSLRMINAVLLMLYQFFPFILHHLDEYVIHARNHLTQGLHLHHRDYRFQQVIDRRTVQKSDACTPSVFFRYLFN